MRGPVLALIWVALTGCDIIFGPELDVTFRADVVRFEAVSDARGDGYECEVVITATASGDADTRAIFGESFWTFRRLDDGVVLGEERKSSAQMDFFFGSDDIMEGETLQTSPIVKFQPAPFEWSFRLNYRKPNGLRESAETSTRCE